MLLHVKQEIAAFARRVEVVGLRDGAQLGSKESFARAADVFERGFEPALGEVFTRGLNVAPASLAVETEMQKALRLQQRQQGTQALFRVFQMVQDAGRIDHVETA